MMIPSIFQLGSFTFHTYGFLLGLAIVFAISLIEKKFKIYNYDKNCFWTIVIFSLFFGILGARAWHVMTDFYLYSNNFEQIFYVWNGGLSIFGGLIGIIFGIYLGIKLIKPCNNISFIKVLDIMVFGLPVGQLIGRLGNYVNQELYGFPTNSFLKIHISPENRLPFYKDVAYYHPLFLYEMIPLAIFFIVVYYLDNKTKLLQVGSGKLFLTYLTYYLILRFLLDFIRIDKVMFVDTSFSINQIFIILALSSILLIHLFNKIKNNES
ncbi:MAG: prolipoprotein diacylglyceryl transferase [Pseudomonadales bacterium]|nr:prolipoprotein diacylglyceryl transferase [Pseudomonadales bacterium]